MACEYGILKGSTNTGSNAELLCSFAAPLSIVNNAPETGGDTMSLRRKVATSGYQRWEIETAIVPNNTRQTYAHMTRHGAHGEFYLRMPQLYVEENPYQDSLNVSLANSYAAGATIVKLKTPFPTDMQTTEWVGMFVSFVGNDKVYMISNTTWDSGDQTLEAELFPPLIAPVTNNSEVKHSSKVSMRAYYNDSKSTVKYSDGILAEFSAIRFLEAL